MFNSIMDSHIQKNEIGYFLHQTQLKIDQIHKNKTGNCKTPRKKQGESFMTLVLAMISWM